MSITLNKIQLDVSNAIYSAELTTKCTGKCIICPRDEYRHPIEDMSFDTFKRAADESASLGIKHMSLCGMGESLMDKGIRQKLEYISNKYTYIELSMVSTCQLLTGDMLELICEHIDMLKISMYGFDIESYEAVHGGALKYDLAKENIDALLERKKRPYVVMTYCVLPQNQQTVDAWREYFEPRCERIDIWKPHNWGGGKCIADGEIIGLPCRRMVDLSNLMFCADGSVAICCFDFNRELIIGNINEMTLIDMINRDKVKQMQEKHMEKCISGLKCEHCDQIRGREDALIYSNAGMEVGKPSMLVYNRG